MNQQYLFTFDFFFFFEKLHFNLKVHVFTFFFFSCDVNLYIQKKFIRFYIIFQKKFIKLPLYTPIRLML